MLPRCGHPVGLAHAGTPALVAITHGRGPSNPLGRQVVKREPGVPDGARPLPYTFQVFCRAEAPCTSATLKAPRDAGAGEWATARDPEEIELAR